MANILTAGNSSNGGTAISTDTSGTLNIVTGSGSGANAITIDASQVVTIPGNLTVSGTLTATSGVSGGIRSGTAVASTSGTSIDFTSLPTGLKRITVMFNGVSTNSTSLVQVQLGAGSVTTSGYNSYVAYAGGSNQTSGNTYSSGFIVDGGLTGAAAFIRYGILTFTNITGNTWVAGLQGSLFNGTSYFMVGCSGSIALGSVLDRIRITTINGTDTFDAGSINILFE